MKWTRDAQCPDAPILPEGFAENSAKRPEEIEDGFTPVSFEERGTPKYDILEMVYHLFYTQRFVWFDEYGKFYRLGADGKYRECSETTEIGNAIICKLKKRTGKDNSTKGTHDNFIHKLKCTSENLLDRERESFFSDTEDGLEIKEHYQTGDGDLPLIHVANGWINPNAVCVSKRDANGEIIRDANGEDIPTWEEGILLPECGLFLNADSLFWLKVNHSKDGGADEGRIPYDELQRRLHFKAEREDMERYPTFQSILDGIIPDCDTQRFLLSRFASTILDRFGDPTEPIITMLHGVGGTGKTTLISCVEKMLGSDGFIETTFKSIGGSFGMETLIGKKMLVINEVQQITENTMNELKRISDGHPITFDRKHRSSLTTDAYAHDIFMTNNKVPSFDLDSGSIRRLAVIETSSFLPISINAPDVMTSDEGITWLFGKLLRIWTENRKEGISLQSLISEEMKSNLEYLTTEKNPVMAWIKFRFGSIGRDPSTVEEVRQGLTEGYFDEHLKECGEFIKENEETYPDTDCEGIRFSRDFKETICHMYGLRKVQTRKGDGSKRYRFAIRDAKDN